MKTVNTRSFPRAGFLGNPSDGYFGKTMSFAFSDYCVDLTLTESAKMRFVPGEVDDATFDSPEKLVRDIRLYGYYGGIRMLKAVAKLFFEYCFENGIRLENRNFTAEYRTNIPRLVGLSGSSAICSAMLKALMKFYSVEIPLEHTPTICLEAEKLELGINCGFQDRVIQMYNGLVFMDFEKSFVEANNRGIYERLDPALLPNIYVAFDLNRAEESGKAHKKVKKLFEEKKPDILSAMSEFADIAQKGRDALVAGRKDLIAGLVNAN
ncbi:MAG: GHMP kinase, partial [Kiritimatiellae bacterium]|nr:GHMP kinase [Kiritimatiellia bacterium]